MAVLGYQEIEDLFLYDLQAKVSVDPAFTTGVANQAGILINDAYAAIWEQSGGRIKKVPSSAAWDSAQKVSGVARGLLTDVGEVLHIYATTTAPTLVLGCTATGTALVTANSFAGLVEGMAVSGTGVPANTFISSITSTTALTLNQAATSASNTLTFSPVESTNELDLNVDLAQIHWARSNPGIGTYTIPQMAAVVRVASPGTTDVNKLLLEYWPGSTGYYFPMAYKPQFVPMDATITTPDVNDLESRDIAHLAALLRAPLAGRTDLMEPIAMLLSENGRLAMERKLSALADAKQDA